MHDEGLLRKVADATPHRDEGLLRKAADQIRANPKGYDQKHWHRPAGYGCGSTSCVAGHIVSLAEGFEKFAVSSYIGFSDVVMNGRPARVRDAAAVAAGLTEYEDEMLFAGNWLPAGHDTKPLHEAVADALYALADGATIGEVTATRT